MSSASDDATSAAAASVAQESAEPFDEWASRQRRRATLDGAWKVEVWERVLPDGGRIRSVATWHDTAKKQPTPQRRAQRQGSVESGRSQQPSKRSATDELRPQQQTARQRRSALRSAAHHRLIDTPPCSTRILACGALCGASRILLRLSAAACALRDGLSAGKRRAVLLLPASSTNDRLLRTTLSCVRCCIRAA